MHLRRLAPNPWLKRILRRVSTIPLGLGILLLFVTFTPITEWWVKALTGPRVRPRGDTLIVLGADRYDTRTIGVFSYWRCVYAAEAYRERRIRTIVASGGGSTAVPIAETLKECLVFFKVPEEDILLETSSNSTRQNALFVTRMLAPEEGRIVLLTSDVHMFRARRCFEKLGIHVETWPSPDVLRMAGHPESRWSAFLALCVESAKIGYYLLRGWI